MFPIRPSDFSKDMIGKVKEAAHQICILHGTCTARTKEKVDRYQFFPTELEESSDDNLEPKVTASPQKSTVEEDLARHEKIELSPLRSVKEKVVAKRAEETEWEDFDIIRRTAGDHVLVQN